MSTNSTAKLFVAPRVISKTTGERVLLSDEIEFLLRAGKPTHVLIQGVGKSTALRHLAECFRDDGRVVIEDERVLHRIRHSTFVVKVVSNQKYSCDHKWTLAGWERDDCIEYLLLKNPTSCRSVMQRLSPECFRFANGSPDVWASILDRMAQDESIIDIERTVLEELRYRIGQGSEIETLALDKRDEFAIRQIGELADSFLVPSINTDGSVAVFELVGCRSASRLLEVADVRIALMADRFIERILAGSTMLLIRNQTIGLLKAVAKRALVLPALREELSKQALSLHQTAALASLMLMIDSDWRPNDQDGQDLSAGYFPEARWAKCQFRKASLNRSLLRHAKLDECDLTGATLMGTILNHASLKRTTLSDVLANHIDLRNTDLSNCYMPNAMLRQAQLQYSVFRESTLVKSSFRNSDLSSASFVGANTLDCDFHGARLEAADFTDAVLRGAKLSGVDLREAIFCNTNLNEAVMRLANLEGVDFKGCTLDNTNLSGAYLTCSKMRNASMTDCNLSLAGLAEIDWEDCDLRGANMLGVSFHMGSTRSGLVDSPYPSHGTRTGFYTNDYDDLYFKRPEEIRKANLRGCDLREANITDVDFYLVDLRDAKYSTAQQQQFIATGAILK